MMREAEQRGRDYLFKLRQTKNVKRLIQRMFSKAGWEEAGHGWQGKRARLRLQGWSRERNVVVLRCRLKGGLVAAAQDGKDQLHLGFAEIEAEIENDTAIYEYAVLVTSLEGEILTIAQLYRDRAVLRPGILRVVVWRHGWWRWFITGGHLEKLAGTKFHPLMSIDNFVYDGSCV